MMIECEVLAGLKLAAAGRRWSVERAVQAWQKGHHPKGYVLRRRDETGGTGD